MMNVEEILFGIMLGASASGLNLFTWKLLFEGLGKRSKGEAAGLEFFSALALKSLIFLLLIACLSASGEACIVSFIISFIVILLCGSLILTGASRTRSAGESVP
jgi:hypothetical protein